jgi:alcohol dehydrogenase
MPRTSRIVAGTGSAQTIGDELKQRSLNRVMIFSSPSVSRTDSAAEILRQLKDVTVEVIPDIRPHNPAPVLTGAIERARELKPDAIVAVGGGSVVDAAKLAVLAVSEDVPGADIAGYRVEFRYPAEEIVRPLNGTPAPVFAVPTTLSAAEWDGFAGTTDPEEHNKSVIRYRELTPAVVFLDPVICRTTPKWIWATTGIRAVDHAVETLLAAPAAVGGTPRR